MTVLLAGSELKLTNTMNFESFFVCKHGFSFDFIRESFDFVRESCEITQRALKTFSPFI